MTESTPPDGHQPADPPRIPETPSTQAYTGEPEAVDATPPRAQRPDAAAGVPDDARSTVERPGFDQFGGSAPTAAFAAASTPPPANQPPPPAAPRATSPFPPQGGSVPPFGAAPGPAAGGPSGPAGPGYGGGPPAGFGGPGGTPPAAGEPKKKKSGLLVGGLVALVVALAGGLGFLVLQSGSDDGDADEPRTTREEEPEDTEPEDTQPEDTQPEVTTVTVSPSTIPPITDPVEEGTVENLFVRVNSFADVITDDEIEIALQTLGQSTGDNPVATTEDVLNLCAAVALDSPTTASDTWTRDGETISTGTSRLMETPADGKCINNNGEPLAAGSYEVSFTDAGGGMSGVALFTVGAETVTQTFFNDTGADVCSVDVGPTTVDFFQPFTLVSDEPLLVGESILIDVAGVEHEGRALDCNDEPLESFFFVPSSGGEINLSDGSAVEEEPPPTTVPPVVPITDFELNEAPGQIASFPVPVGAGTETNTVIDTLLIVDNRLPIATTDESLSLCAAWQVPGALEADIVWEFNRIEVARIPAVAVDGQIGVCVPPGGSAFDEGAYQAYLQRGDVPSPVLTFTVGREETQLAFRNDTGVAICEVGFSPNLTNFYSFFVFAESADFDEALVPGEAFTIVAPFIENDIRAVDCDGNDVSETFNIAPTDQTLDLTTGQP